MTDNSLNIKIEGPLAIPLACCSMILPLVLTISLGVFAFANPDNEAWVGKSSDGSFKLYKDEGAGKGSTDLVDIHGRLVAWFLWGFMQHLVVPALLLISSIMCMLVCMPLNALCQICGSACMVFMCCGTSCSYMAWWITGIVWRFSSDGRYSVGDIVPAGKSNDDWSKELEADDSLY